MLTHDEAFGEAQGGAAGAATAAAGGLGASAFDASDAAGARFDDAGSRESPPIEPPDADGAPGANIGPPDEADGVLRLAFLEDPDEGVARLQLIDVRQALFSTDPPEGWRRSLAAQKQAGSALDFAWSPDGRRLVLRHETIDGPRLAFFAVPSWTELPLTELTDFANQPDLVITSKYAWSPDGSVLAIELASAEGPAIGAYRVSATGADALTPIAFSSQPESMAWADASHLFVVHDPAGGRELIALEAGSSALSQQRPGNNPDSFVALRPAPGGVLGASDDSVGFLHFWTAAGGHVQHDSRSYLSSDSAFVAVPAEPPQPTTLESIEDTSPLVTLPDCPTILTWIEGPTPGSLVGSRVACHALVNGAAVIRIYTFDESSTPDVVVLDDDRISSAFVVESNWAPHARSFSTRGDWLALTTATSDVFIDLRQSDAPLYYVRENIDEPGATARTFSANGAHLLVQRGQQLLWLVLGASAEQTPEPWRLQATLTEAAACSTARNAPNWCGAPRSGESTGPRWAKADEIVALLSQDEGLVVTSVVGDAALRSISVSTCGAACVRAFAFSP